MGGNLPLHKACEFSSLDLVTHLVEIACCDINAENEDGYTSLHVACEKEQLEIVKYLISKPKCNRELENKQENRPLHVACASRNLEIVKYLVDEAHCDINAKGQNGYTALHIACNKNAIMLVKYLIDHSEWLPVKLLTSNNELQGLIYNHYNYKQALNSSGVAYLRVVKCILTGPPGAGKSTLKKRLLNESLT